MHRSSACSLAELESRLRYDLAFLNEPPGRWARTLMALDGRLMLDALVVGGGMCGMVTASDLRWLRLTRILLAHHRTQHVEGPCISNLRSSSISCPIQL